MGDSKEQILEATIKNLEKTFGKGIIMKLGERESLKIPVVSSGSLSIDIAIGCGGYPRGRFIEIFGPEASGKTTIALHAIASVQRKGGKVAFIDAEHALDPIYAKNLGVDVNELLISQPDYGEQALEIAEELASSGAVDLIVIDSVAALVPKSELEGSMGDMQVGLQARLMSQALRKLVSTIGRTQTIIIFTNQLRQKIGMGAMYGVPETTTGGVALKFYASVRIDVRKVDLIKEGEKAIGSRVKIKIAKNKVAPPFREALVDIIYGQGISYEGELVDLGLEYGIIEKSGSWFSYGDINLGQGREQAKTFLKENPQIAREIEKKIREKAGLDSSELIADYIYDQRKNMVPMSQEGEEIQEEVEERKGGKRGKKSSKESE
jgi:recombination protein RecA